ncbi:Retrovirus-related Pol polyprotein from transposon TNT 1-94 [Podarcis lilfordi]|uniref:Retrovirus-related Pol polyprotein from transposon TNT 1-94 n=1 Tax=Podarcis lilfordi TaxID=74358 RepID=A0AA35LNC6_9SAUR|nr:Retrovirus-related Pol polyprotein from transposon TNT 1-94 [Podarcis lilfordi]
MARAAFDSDAKLGMPVLNEYNFIHWKQRLIACLDYKHILEALKPQPTGTTEGDLAKISAWKRMNSEARHIILSGLRDEQLSLINSTDDASQILRDIERMYGESSINCFRNLVCKLTRLRMNSKEEFTEHINKFTEIIQRIDLTPKAFDEDTKIAFLLSSLGPRFSAFVSLMAHRQGLTFKDLIGYLKEECRDRAESPVRNARIKDSGYASRQFTKSKEMPKKVICFNCNKEGHIAKNCRAPKAKKPHPFQPKVEKKGKCECTWLLQERNLTVQNRENKRNKWILDSGASSHFCHKRDYFNEINDEEGSEIEIADGNIVKAKGAGSMSLKCNINNECIENTISRVLYVPELSCNLISVSTLDKKGFQITFGNGECKVTRNGKVFAQAKLINGVYELDLSENQSAKVAHSSQKDEADLDLWHRRLGHRDTNVILDLQKRDLVRGLQVKQSNKAPAKCISCITEKAVKPSFPRCAEQRSNKVLDIVHTDICGPMNVPSLGKNRYILIFLDDFSRFCVVYFLKEKSETVDKLQEYIAMVKNKFQRAPAVLMSDNGGEYCSNEMQALLAKEGIAHVTTIPYTPQQNAIAERKFRSIMDMTRCMLKDACLPQKLWAEGVYTSVYLQNRLPPKGAERTPFELWHGKAPNLSHIRVFGSPCYFHVPKEHRHKLDSRAKAGILVGYASGGKGYRIMDLQTGKTNAYHAVYVDEYGKVDTKNTVVDSSDESERTQEFVYFPFETPQSTNLASSVTAPPTGDAPEDTEDQNPGGTRDEDEDSDGDMPALEEDEEADAVAEPEAARAWNQKLHKMLTQLGYKQGDADKCLYKSEYVAATEACREIVWLDQLIKDFGLVRKGPVSLLEDNQSCLKLTQSERFLAKTKHIGVKYHYIRQMIQDGLVELSYCSTQEMTADILTKPLPRESFQNLRVKLGLWVVE